MSKRRVDIDRLQELVRLHRMGQVRARWRGYWA